MSYGAILVATKAVLYLFNSRNSGKHGLIFPPHPVHEPYQISLMEKVLVVF